MRIIRMTEVSSKALFLNSLLMLSAILLPLAGGMLPASETIVRILLGNQWIESVPVMQVCCLFVPIDFLTSIAATLLSATARLRTQILIELLFILVLGSSILVFAKN